MVTKISKAFTGMIVAGGILFGTGLYADPQNRLPSKNYSELNLACARIVYSDLTNRIAQAYVLPYDSKRLEIEFGNSSENLEEYINLLVKKAQIVERDIAEMEAMRKSSLHKKK